MPFVVPASYIARASGRIPVQIDTKVNRKKPMVAVPVI